MKILILSMWGGGTALGWRLAREGHQVCMWVKPNGEPCRVGDGFFRKVESWQEAKDWADLIIADDGRLGKISDQLKKQGKVVWGGSEATDELELDRGKGQKALKDVGMTIIPSKEFSGLPEALAFVKANPKRWCAKPNGDIQDEKALTYVGKEDDASDMIATLEQYQAKWASKIKSIELQEFKKGVEVGISGFFTGHEFVEPIEISFEHKKLMPGNIGPSSGEMGTSMAWMSKRKIYRESIGRCVKLLEKLNYTGYVDINCIATEKELWPLEWTTRFGYPTIQLKMETMRGDLGGWMRNLAAGNGVNLKISGDFSVCVVVATPPYPFQSDELYEKFGEDQQVLFKGKDRAGIWPGEIRKEKEDWILTGGGGFSVICTGSGASMEAARKMAYKRVDSFTIPNAFWRIDIGEKTDEDLKTLNRWGWFAP